LYAEWEIEFLFKAPDGAARQSGDFTDFGEADDCIHAVLPDRMKRAARWHVAFDLASGSLCATNKYDEQFQMYVYTTDQRVPTIFSVFINNKFESRLQKVVFAEK
jgi:hypothetical protein